MATIASLKSVLNRIAEQAPREAVNRLVLAVPLKKRSSPTFKEMCADLAHVSGPGFSPDSPVIKEAVRKGTPGVFVKAVDVVTGTSFDTDLMLIDKHGESFEHLGVLLHRRRDDLNLAKAKAVDDNGDGYEIGEVADQIIEVYTTGVMGVTAPWIYPRKQKNPKHTRPEKPKRKVKKVASAKPYARARPGGGTRRNPVNLIDLRRAGKSAKKKGEWEFRYGSAQAFGQPSKDGKYVGALWEGNYLHFLFQSNRPQEIYSTLDSAFRTATNGGAATANPEAYAHMVPAVREQLQEMMLEAQVARARASAASMRKERGEERMWKQREQTAEAALQSAVDRFGAGEPYNNPYLGDAVEAAKQRRYGYPPPPPKKRPAKNNPKKKVAGARNLVSRALK